MALINRAFLAVAISAASLGAPAISSPAHAQDHVVTMQHSPWLALRFEQDGRYVPLSRDETITSQVTLKSEPFTIVLPVRGDDDLYRITAWTDDSIFAAALEAKANKRVDGNLNSHEPPRFFGPYNSMADTAAGSGTLMLDPEGHHSLLGLRLGPEPDRHTFHVSSVLGDDDKGNNKHFALRELDGPLFLVAWYDEDGDEKMDHGEYEFLVLNFK